MSEARALEEAEWVRRVHDTHGRGLYLYAYRALGDNGAAEEILQDTLVRAWRNVERFDPERGSLEAWLFAIARNLIIDHERRRARRPQTAASLDTVEDRETTADPGTIDRALEAWQVAEALRQLTPEHREVIIESYYRGSPVADAARRLDIPPGTVKSRLYYGLRALRVVLEEMGVIE